MVNLKRRLGMFGLVLSFISLPILTLAENPVDGKRPDSPDAKGIIKEMMGKDKVKLFGEKGVLRLTMALNRADGFRQRVAFRLDRFPNPKFDLALVSQKLAEANDAIARGRLAVAAIQTALDNSLAQTGTTGSFGEIRAKIKETKEIIRIAHQKIIEAIRLIKASYSAKPSATSTLSN